MIDTVIMMGSLVVLGYAFYISSRMFWTFKSRKGSWKWMYGLASLFVIVTYSLFAMVMFSFIASFFTSYSILNVLNVVIGVFFLSSSGLIGAIMKYHMSVMKSVTMERKEADLKIKEISKEKLGLEKEIDGLRKELDEARKLKMSRGHNLKVAGLEKKIEKLEKKK